MSDDLLFREVDEEVRRDEVQKLWNKYGSWAVALSVGVVVAVAAFKGWQYWQKTQAEASGAAYFKAVRLVSEGKQDDADRIFEELSRKKSGYGVFARLFEAGELAKAGKTAKAVAAYDAIANSGNVDEAIRQLAGIRAAYLLADSASVDELQKRLKAFSQPSSPWRNQAREVIALAAWRAGNYLLADRMMNEVLADPLATGEARQRARVFLSVLAPKLASSASKSK